MFKEVARHGSLTRAAKELTYTTSAVSQHMSALERELGAVLFERLPRGVRLTKPGEALLSHVERILEEYRAARQTVRTITSVAHGRVRLGAFAAANATVVATAVARFRSVYPRTEVELRRVEPDEAVGLMAVRELDLAITYAYPEERLPSPDGMHLQPLLEDRLHVLLPRTHLMAGEHEVRLAEMVGEKWVRCADKRSANVLTSACLAAGFVPEVALCCDDETDLPGLTAAGVGVALISGLSRAAHRSDVVVRPIAGDPVVRQVYAMSPNGAPAPRSVTAMLTMLANAATDREMSETARLICGPRRGD
ncbi:hypothetical protein BLA60_03270 [Actinophytocola xinjiangensis]|uniref:HTH lysR-type domain-containing protein n=1 Tax=Actinophytocola xinjiangensis TaxID=485602 RepID=A0A7Z1B1N8_9PSEU|nr:hypothetical protein BLA60_03270 [Actinophytocola xinjiangensis]